MYCPVEKQDGAPVTARDGQPTRMRCVREVALRYARGHVTWEVIEYAVGVPGVRFLAYQSMSVYLRALSDGRLKS